MLEELIIDILPPIISICELMGIFVVAVSALRAFWHYCRGLVSRTPRDVKFELANAPGREVRAGQRPGHQPGI